MPDLQFTPDLNPSTVRKTVEHLAPHTATHLNRVQDRLVGRSCVLRGLELLHDGTGLVTIKAGTFIAGGVVVDLLESIQVDYSDALATGGYLPQASSRTRSIVLYGYCEDSKASSEIRFGYIFDDDLASIAGPEFVVLGALIPSDDTSATEVGAWVLPYSYSLTDLASDIREGVQNIEAPSFMDANGARRANPSFTTGPYFLHSHELLVFADRFLIPDRAFLAGVTPGYTRRGLRGISEVGFDSPAAFDFDGRWADAADLTLAKWGFVVCRDIEWQQVEIYPSVGGPPPYVVLDSTADAERLLVFENGLWLPPSEVTLDVTNTQVTLANGYTADNLYHFVHLRHRVFYEEVQISATDLAALDVPQNYDVSLVRNTIDLNRNTVMVFLRPTAPGSANDPDGGYVQINRTGYSTRASQGIRVENGFTVKHPTALTLRGLAMGSGAVVTVGILCLRGATPLNVFESDVATSGVFFRRLEVVGDAPTGDEVLASVHMDGFVVAAPSGGSEEVSVALHEASSDDPPLTPDGLITIREGFFAEWTLEQGPDYATEASSFKSPRRISASSAATLTVLSGFSGQWQTVDLTVDGGAQAAVAGSPVRLRASRLVEGLPAYPVGQNRLRVALDGVKLVLGRDFEESSTTSILVRVPMAPGQYLEAWVE